MNRRALFILAAGLFAALPISGLIWTAVEHMRDAADRAH